MKYVMLKRQQGSITQYLPVIFPNILVHADMTKALISDMPDCTVHSAGDISPIDMKACGGSTTLRLQSDPDDSYRILMNDYGGAYE